jgi:AraC-like DNA-binding protein
MIDRCTEPNSEKYPIYGGRGITICERWMKFENFLADMGEKVRGMSIERINNNGNYEPENCKWATPKEQANNTRRNRRIAHNGENLTLAEWSQRLGVTPSTLHERIAKHGEFIALSFERKR